MKKSILLIIAIIMLFSSASADAARSKRRTPIPAKETATIEQTIHATYVIYKDFASNASVPGGAIDQTGIKCYDQCLGKDMYYYNKPFTAEFVKQWGGWQPWELKIMKGAFDSVHWGTVLYLEFDDNGYIFKATTVERFKSYKGTIPSAK